MDQGEHSVAAIDEVVAMAPVDSRRGLHHGVVGGTVFLDFVHIFRAEEPGMGLNTYDIRFHPRPCIRNDVRAACTRSLHYWLSSNADWLDAGPTWGLSHGRASMQTEPPDPRD